MATTRDLAATVLGEAAMAPQLAPQIFKRASQNFARLAKAPQNSKISQELSALAQHFAAAADRPGSVEDFHDLLRESAEAYEQVGDYEEDMDPIARRAEIHAERTPGLPRVSIAPKSINRTTRLGDQATIKYQPTDIEIQNGVRETNTIIYWQGEKEESQTFTVDIDVLQPLPRQDDPSLPQPGARPYGIVIYAADGSQAKAVFDIGSGVRFTGVGNYVSILIGMEPPPPGRFSAPLTVGALMGMFAAPSTAPLIRTVYIDDLDNGETTPVITRPLKAVTLLPPQSSEIGAFGLYEFLDASMNVLYALKLFNSSLGAPIPLANDVVYIRVTHNGAVSANYRLPFQLSL